MTAAGRIGGYGYVPPAIYEGPSAPSEGVSGPMGRDESSSRGVGGVIYKTREGAGGRGMW